MNTETFRKKLCQTGLEYTGSILADGKLHRFKAGNDKNRNSWYVLHQGSPMSGAFGCWKRGISETWCAVTDGSLSQAEWDVVRTQWKEANSLRVAEERVLSAKARETAAWILDRSVSVDPDHPYLLRKGIKAHGELRQRGDLLVLPLQDTKGDLHSLQFIHADGTKRFLRGGRIAGCLFTGADDNQTSLVICEGYATGASIREAVGYAVVCAMNCGNLMAVAHAIRSRWPDREIIVAADDDRFTAGNPGIAKATDAARAIRARLAWPRFKDDSTKPTDFNDLHLLEGIQIVKTQIESASAPIETDQEAFDRLAQLSATEYDRARKSEAARLEIRKSTLDKEVNGRRPPSESNAQGQSIQLPNEEPWPDEVDGAEVLGQIVEVFNRYLALPPGAPDAMALWAAHTHSFTAFLHTPRLNFYSPDKGCGKTTALDCLASMSARPLRTESITSAVLFRLVETHKPTLLLDEVDAYLNDAEELRGLLNAGHKRGAMAYRCEGENNQVRGFACFAPAVLAGIGALPGTLHDRSIVVKLVRARPGEVKARFDSRRTGTETELGRKLARWAADNFTTLEKCDPLLPDGAFNRMADNWRPLFAIAQTAGGDWPARATTAFSKLTAGEDLDAQGIGVMLLADLKSLFDEAKAERIFSKCATDALCGMTDRPWPEARKGKPISETWLAHRLRNFGVRTKTIRIGEDRAKGYELEDLREAFSRFLPDPPFSKRDSVTTPINIAYSPAIQSVTGNEDVTDENPHETPVNIELSRCHASEPREREEMLL